MNTYITIADIVLFLASTGYWAFRIRKDVKMFTVPLTSMYALLCFSLTLTSLLLCNTASLDHYDIRNLHTEFSIGPLFIFPSYCFIFMTVVNVKVPSLKVVLSCISPVIIYCLLAGLSLLLYAGKTDSVISRIHDLATLVYNLLFFVSALISVVYAVYRYHNYTKQIHNYYYDKTDTDYLCISGLNNNLIMMGILTFVIISLRLMTFCGNWVLTSIFLISLWFIVNYLGYNVQKFKGKSLPADIDWQRQNLTLKEIESLERKFKEADEAERYDTAFSNIKETIERWASKPSRPYLAPGISIASVAEQTGIPTIILSSYLNKKLNMNFNQWINMHRIEVVKMMLLTTNKNLDEISDACGFGNRSLMTRSFKLFEGISPSEFRTMNKTSNS